MLVLACALGAVLATSDRAQAFAWTDDCTMQFHNGSPVTVHLATWLAFPPTPGTPPWVVATYIAVGLEPHETGMLLQNRGAFITGGCHGTVVLAGATPVGAVSCAYSAPTEGANHFDCSDNAEVQWFQNDDDIYVQVNILGRGKTATPLIPLRKPKPPGSGPLDGKAKALALKRSDLPAGNWRALKHTKGLGTLAGLIGAGPQSPQCGDHSNQGEVRADGTGATLFARGGGAVSAFSLVNIFPGTKPASKLFEQSLSPHSARCLAQLLSVHTGKFATRATATRHVFRAIDVRNEGYRIAIRGKVAGRPWRGYLDVFALQHKGTWSLVGFFKKDAPWTDDAEQRATVAVGERISR